MIFVIYPILFLGKLDENSIVEYFIISRYWGRSIL